MTKSDTKREVREMYVQTNVGLIKSLLDFLLALLNQKGPDAAGTRAACARAVIALMEEIVEVTG